MRGDQKGSTVSSAVSPGGVSGKKAEAIYVNDYGDIKTPPPVFVFGSNLIGNHGNGAAKFAKLKHGAKEGVGEGRCGDSYAIPTKITSAKSLPYEEVCRNVQAFLQYAEKHYWDTFHLTAIGTGYAGFGVEDIAPLFGAAPKNVKLPKLFLLFLDRDASNAWDKEYYVKTSK